jgi:predicted dehydrogenase
MNRRKFVKTTAAGVSALAAAPYLYAAAGGSKPKRVGLIGCGWFGTANLLRFVQVAPVEVVALCDVDKKALAETAEKFASLQVSKKTPRTYGDYRELLKEKDLDVVIVGTPDHWHALTGIAAMEAGADLYLEKPISVDVVEGEALVSAARRLGRVVQVNTQRRSTPHLIEARDKYIRSGVLGKIGLVEICCYFHMRNTTNPPDIKPPDTLDYEMWTGPAPMRPYNNIIHPRGWRNFFEYSNGILGDMCVHLLDCTRWMMGLGWPKKISSTGGILIDKDAKANVPDTQLATYEYDDLQIIWQHRTWGAAPDEKQPWAMTFYGDKGTLKASVTSYDYTSLDGKTTVHVDPLVEQEKYPDDAKDAGKFIGPAMRRHVLDFLAAVETRSKPVADIAEAHISTASCILANMALKLGRPLVWDPVKRQIVGDDEANRLLARPYRNPWQHPAAGGLG